MNQHCIHLNSNFIILLHKSSFFLTEWHCLEKSLFLAACLFLLRGIDFVFYLVNLLMYHLVISYLKTKKLLLYLLNFLGHSHWLFFKVWYTSITIVWVMVDLQYEVNDHNGFKHVGTQWNLSLNSCSADFPVYTLDSCTNIPYKNRLQMKSL